jgi:hypothetical protein
LQIGHAGYQTGVEFSAESKFIGIFSFTASGIVLIHATRERQLQNGNRSSKQIFDFKFRLSGKFYPCLIPSMPYLQELLFNVDLGAPAMN